jgi:hypothetical protein
MAKVTKAQRKKNVKEKMDDGTLSDQMTYEDFNKEKPLPDDPEFKISDIEKLNEEATKAYACFIHNEVQSAKPGKCYECGESLVEKK